MHQNEQICLKSYTINYIDTSSIVGCLQKKPSSKDIHELVFCHFIISVPSTRWQLGFAHRLEWKTPTGFSCYLAHTNKYIHIHEYTDKLPELIETEATATTTTLKSSVFGRHCQCQSRSKWSPGRVIECYRTLLTFLFAH